jgi:riboflavin synthase
MDGRRNSRYPGLAGGAPGASRPMFTGLIREKGTILEPPVPSGQGGVRLRLGFSEALSADLSTGASLAVAGVCLTVFDLAPGRAAVELAPETLARTTLRSLAAGDEVNLETALRAGDALGGHWVQGHVDGTTAVVARRDLAEHRELAFALPPALAPFLAEKGSITVDGVSLTVASLADDRFTVALIPHTLAETTLSRLDAGAAVNLEVDVLAKYVHRILASRGLAAPLP